MMVSEQAPLLDYLTIALTVGLNSISVGFGQGLAGRAALDAIDQQPRAQGEITKATLIGTALMETTALLATAIAIVLFASLSPATMNLYPAIARLGIACALGLPGLVIGAASAMPTCQAALATARQPFFAQPILNLLLITQSLVQTPVLFGVIIALFIKGQADACTTLTDSIRLLSSGLAIGLGIIGPSIGLAHFAQAALRGVGINRAAYAPLRLFTFISEAIIETPVLFALMVALIMLFVTPATNDNLLQTITFIGAAIAVGVGNIAPGISSSNIGATAALNIAHRLEHYSLISRLSIFAQVFIDTCAIYAVIISLLLLLLSR